MSNFVHAGIFSPAIVLHGGLKSSPIIDPCLIKISNESSFISWLMCKHRRLNLVFRFCGKSREYKGYDFFINSRVTNDCFVIDSTTKSKNNDELNKIIIHFYRILKIHKSLPIGCKGILSWTVWFILDFIFSDNSTLIRI